MEYWVAASQWQFCGLNASKAGYKSLYLYIHIQLFIQCNFDLCEEMHEWMFIMNGDCSRVRRLLSDLKLQGTLASNVTAYFLVRSESLYFFLTFSNTFYQTNPNFLKWNWATSKQVLVQPAIPHANITSRDRFVGRSCGHCTITPGAGQFCLLILVVNGKTNRVTCSITSVMNSYKLLRLPCIVFKHF